MSPNYAPDMPVVPNAQKTHRSGWRFLVHRKKFIQNQQGILNKATRSPKIIISHIGMQWEINGLIRRSKVAGNRPSRSFGDPFSLGVACLATS